MLYNRSLICNIKLFLDLYIFLPFFKQVYVRSKPANLRLAESLQIIFISNTYYHVNAAMVVRICKIIISVV